MTALAQINPWTGPPIMEQLFLFSPMLALVVTMLAVVTVPMIAGRGARTVGGVSVLGIVVTFVLALRVTKAVSDQGVSGFSTQAAAGMLIADNLSMCYQIVLLLFLAAVTYLWWIGSAETEENAPEFFVLLIGSALGMALMASTAHVLMIVVAIEAASLPSYAVVGFDKQDRKGAEASLKYMVFGAVSAAIMLYGASILYGLVGSLNVADVARFTANHMSAGSDRLLLGLGLFCLLGGIAFKISAVPFHFWCPDAFEGAKIEVTTWLSVASKAAGLVLLARIVLIFCEAVDVPQAMPQMNALAWTIGLMAAITCTVGNFAAYLQNSVKRLLAYSSIAHAGYMMMAAAVFMHPDVQGAQEGLAALLIYIVIYLFMNLGAFTVVALVVWNTGSDRVESFNGLAWRAPWLAWPMVLCLMSLVGLPPLAGFLGKWWILVALGRMGTTLAWVLVIVAVVNTLISLYYYLRLVVQMVLRDERRPALNCPIGGVVLVNLCAFALLALFVLADPMKSRVGRFSQGLYPASVASRVEAKPVATAEAR